MTPDFYEKHSGRLYPFRHWLLWMPMLGIVVMYQLERFTGTPTPRTWFTKALAVAFIFSITLAFIASLFPTGLGSLSPSRGQPRSRSLNLRRWVTALLLSFFIGFGLYILLGPLIALPGADR